MLHPPQLCSGNLSHNYIRSWNGVVGSFTKRHLRVMSFLSLEVCVHIVEVCLSLGSLMKTLASTWFSLVGLLKCSPAKHQFKQNSKPN